MIRTLIALLLSLPAGAEPSEEYTSPPTDPPAPFAIIAKGGRLHFVCDSAVFTHVAFREPWFRGEGTHTYLTAKENPAGLCLHFALDVEGPFWLYLECEQTPIGIHVHAHHSNTAEYDEHRVYADWYTLANVDDEPARLTRAAMRRCDLSVFDLDSRPPHPSTLSLAACRLIMPLLDSPRWRVRENVSQWLHGAWLRDATVAVARTSRLSPEARARLADLLDDPPPLPDSLAPTVAALNRE